MAEVLTQFADPVSTSDGSRYNAQACGAPNAQGLWEGWIEFLPINGGPALRSARETTQPNRTDAEYWATGLTKIYLEGALHRTLNPLVRTVAPRPHAMFDEPARPATVISAPPAKAEAVLDPFSVYEKGERILRQELGALAARHLVNVIVAYRFSEEPVSVLNARSSAQLIELIVQGVRDPASVRGRGRTGR
jgi:hypothetical protein